MELLIKRAMEGDAEAFIQLMELCEQSMYKTAKAILANEEDIGDAIQEAILAAYKNISSLKEPSYFKTWLTRILINKCKDIIKENQKVILIDEYKEEGCHDAVASKLEVEECISKLNPQHQVVLNLYYNEGFNTREISQLLDENENTVRSRLKRAKQYFKALFIKSEKGDYENEYR